MYARSDAGASSDPFVLRVFSDADYAGHAQTQRSTTGAAVLLTRKGASVPLSFLSQRQSCVSKSTSEAEIAAMDTALRLLALPQAHDGSRLSARPSPLRPLLAGAGQGFASSSALGHRLFSSDIAASGKPMLACLRFGAYAVSIPRLLRGPCLAGSSATQPFRDRLLCGLRYPSASARCDESSSCSRPPHTLAPPLALPLSVWPLPWSALTIPTPHWSRRPPAMKG